MHKPDLSRDVITHRQIIHPDDTASIPPAGQLEFFLTRMLHQILASVDGAGRIPGSRSDSGRSPITGGPYGIRIEITPLIETDD